MTCTPLLEELNLVYCPRITPAGDLNLLQHSSLKLIQVRRDDRFTKEWAEQMHVQFPATQVRTLNFDLDQ